MPSAAKIANKTSGTRYSQRPLAVLTTQMCNSVVCGNLMVSCREWTIRPQTGLFAEVAIPGRPARFTIHLYGPFARLSGARPRLHAADRTSSKDVHIPGNAAEAIIGIGSAPHGVFWRAVTIDWSAFAGRRPRTLDRSARADR